VSEANNSAPVSEANNSAPVSEANNSAPVSEANNSAPVSEAIKTVIDRLKALWRLIIPHLYGEPGETRGGRIMRRIRIGITVAACLVTLQSVLLVLGAWRNDRQIERHLGVAEANVLDAGPRRSTIEFVTPDRVTYRPELGVLYPSELDTGMRIYVEYDVNNPDLVRVQDRNAALAIIPAGSIAVVGWLVAGAALGSTGMIERRLDRREPVA
jgi:hypothetical protein